MNNIRVSLAIFASAFVIGTLPAHSFVLNFDENGNGTVVTGVTAPAISPAISNIGTSPEGFSGALNYTLPTIVSPGYALVWDDSNKTVLSDVLNFQNVVNVDKVVTGSIMWYYSSPDGNDLADLSQTNWSSLMSDLTSQFGDLTTFGAFATEDVNGNFTYSPGGNVYNGNSSETPEPATMVLFGTGLIGLAGLARRRKNA